MEARYLRKEELLWELRFRGVAAFLGEEGQAKTVAEMEAALTPMIASEREGTVVEYPRYEYDYDVEIPLIETKYRNMLISINQ